MLWVCGRIQKYKAFKTFFMESHPNAIDLSTTPSKLLMTESESIVSHHTTIPVFLGYIEVGWMLDPMHQTRIRKLIRQSTVGMVCHFPESIPNSWKNEIDVFYTMNVNGNTNSIDDGGVI